ncbi:hypothetical protein GQ600_3135 [Phytophthora cactorum]|nr:hypothetical protein GQ600_3135 [Phytophthora cactorum]
MPRGLKTPFQQGHDIKYGLEISERHPETSAVLAVACKFCVKFGREAKPGAKRKKTTNVQYFTPAFRTDNYRRRHKICHPKLWKQYSAAPDEEK